MSTKKKSLGERFWTKVEVTTKDLCWSWKGGLSTNGKYGTIRDEGNRMIMAHRAAYTLTFGPICDNMFVCHKCDNTKCVNPDHLFLGSHLENMQDMRQKGRSPKGSQKTLSKLTELEVVEIKKLALAKISQKEISSSFNISQSLVSRIVNNKTWKHVHVR